LSPSRITVLYNIESLVHGRAPSLSPSTVPHLTQHATSILPPLVLEIYPVKVFGSLMAIFQTQSAVFASTRHLFRFQYVYITFIYIRGSYRIKPGTSTSAVCRIFSRPHLKIIILILKHYFGVYYYYYFFFRRNIIIFYDYTYEIILRVVTSRYIIMSLG